MACSDTEASELRASAELHVAARLAPLATCQFPVLSARLVLERAFQVRAHLEAAVTKFALSSDRLADAVIVVFSRQSPQENTEVLHAAEDGTVVEWVDRDEDPAHVVEVGRFRPSDDVLSLELGCFFIVFSSSCPPCTLLGFDAYRPRPICCKSRCRCLPASLALCVDSALVTTQTPLHLPPPPPPLAPFLPHHGLQHPGARAIPRPSPAYLQARETRPASNGGMGRGGGGQTTAGQWWR